MRYSSAVALKEPLGNDAAKVEALKRVKSGLVILTPHFSRAALADGVLPAIARSAIASGFVQSSEFVDGSWRYRFLCGRFVVVVAFRGESELRFVTFFKEV